SLNHRHRDIRNRAAGVLLVGNGMSAPRAATRLGVSVQSPYNWVKAWREHGVCGLLTGHVGGRPRALPEAMVATALEVATAESLTLARIALRVQAAHGTPLPCRLETLGVALKRVGFSFKRNRFSLKKNATNRRLP
ncbi:helix-turn-helix domain-containing protein, partial [Paraburkholderia azotifigens]|uniref:helix-turn-helix domain-containing protein n=1 Tax=Paraburkholderia azotifigens TaxID=2057004 RepID=UPI00317DF5F4